MQSIDLRKLWRPLLLALSIVFMNAPASRADWRKDLGTFRLGMVESTAHQLSPAELLKVRDAFSKTLSMPVEIIQMRDFPALIDAQASSRIEYAIYSAAAYSTAWISCECVAPLVAPVSLDGSVGTRTALFLDKSVSLANLATSKGIAISGKDSLTAFGVPLSEFTSATGALKGDEPWLMFFDNGSAAVSAMKSGAADAIFASIPENQSLRQPLDPKNAVQNELLTSGRDFVPVWQSQIIPYGPHAIRKNLNPEVKQLLLTFLVNLAANDPDLFELLTDQNAARFAPVGQEAFSSAIKAVRTLAAFSKPQQP
jgi:phosphonate transport system substrate-binding protein